jgi:hypothetical protein
MQHQCTQQTYHVVAAAQDTLLGAIGMLHPKTTEAAIKAGKITSAAKGVPEYKQAVYTLCAQYLQYTLCHQCPGAATITLLNCLLHRNCNFGIYSATQMTGSPVQMTKKIVLPAAYIKRHCLLRHHCI